MLLRKKFFYGLVSVCLSLLTLAQDSLYAQSYDTLRMMSYNLMYYRETTSFCTNTNNNPNAKDGYMEDIMDYVNPDLEGMDKVLNSFISLRVFTSNGNICIKCLSCRLRTKCEKRSKETKVRIE